MIADFRLPIAECRRPGRTSPVGDPEIGNRKSEIGNSRSGQAITEMVVGLVAILVIFAGLLQLGRFGRAHTQALMDARADAATFALSTQYAVQSPAPRYLYNWAEGADGRTHSRDDRPLYAMVDDVRDDVLAHAKPGDLAGRVGDNLVSAAYGSEAILESFRLVHGRGESEDIPLYPIVRDLLYDAESLRLEADVWLTWTRGIE